MAGSTPAHHFQLFSQNPMEQHEQSNHRSDQDNRVEGKHAECQSEITFLRPEEYVRFFTAAIIVLFHFSLGEQVRDFLVNVKLFSCNRTLRVLEKRGIKLLFSGDHGIYQLKIAINFLRGTAFET